MFQKDNIELYINDLHESNFVIDSTTRKLREGRFEIVEASESKIDARKVETEEKAEQ